MADGSPKTLPTPDLQPAFSVLYREHVGMVRRALRQLGVPPGSLDDAVQDVFVVLHRRIDDYERDRSLKNWLWGIARGVASGYRRSERRRDRLQAALPAPEGPGLPERGVARRQAGAILHDFLGSLDADKCAVFVLSELEGRRGPEIAELLDVNVNTVYARLRAARKRFDVAMARHRTPASRPVFAAWLSWAWPTWLGKPAVAAGLGAMAVVAATSVGPVVAIEPPELAMTAVEAPADDDAQPPRWPSAVAPRALAARTPAPPPDDEHDDELLVFEEEPPVVTPRRAAPAPVVDLSASVEPSESFEVHEPEPVVGPPPRAPWSTTVLGQRPVRHPTLLSLRQDFVADLWRLATQI